jgi:hypothetical protein
VPSPLLVTTDAELAEDVLRLAALAGAPCQVERIGAGARSAWTNAALVIVGADSAPTVESFPRRSRVLLAARQGDSDDPDVWRLAVRCGAERVVFLPADESVLVDALTTDRDAAHVLVVVGARGGCGTSTLAVAVAWTAATRRDVALVDLDPRGGDLDLLVGADRQPRAHGSGPLVVDGVTIATEAGRRGRPDPAQLVRDLRRQHDLVVVDGARGLQAQAGYDVAAVTLLLVPAELRAVVSAQRWVRDTPAAGDVRLVVRAPAPGGLRPAEIAEATGLPLLGTLRVERELARMAEHGQPPPVPRGSLARLCRRVLELVPAGGLGVGTAA